MALFAAIHRQNLMLARGDEHGRATVCNARLARHFLVVSYKLATSLELGRCMRYSMTTERGPFLEQRKEETPCFRGAMKVVELLSINSSTDASWP